MSRPLFFKAKILICCCLIACMAVLGCAKKPLPWSRELDRKSLKVFNEGQRYFNEQRYWKARRSYKKVISKFPRSRYADNAQFMLGEIYAVKKKYDMAVEEYHKVSVKYPASDVLPQIAEKEYAIATYYWDKNKKKHAIDIFAKVVEAYRYGDLAPKAQFRVADYYYSEKKDYAEAMVQYEKLLDEFPGLPRQDESVFRLGKCYFEESLMWALDQQYTNQAQEYLEQVVYEYPNSPYVGPAGELISVITNKKAKKEYKTGHFYYWNGDYEAARLYYSSVLEKYPHTPWAGEALFDVGRTFYKERQWLMAEEFFVRVEKEYPGGKLSIRAARMREKCAKKIAKGSN